MVFSYWEFNKKPFQITRNRKGYKILLIPAHVGIKGNKVEDRTAKNASNKKGIMDILVGNSGKEVVRWTTNGNHITKFKNP